MRTSSVKTIILLKQPIKKQNETLLILLSKPKSEFCLGRVLNEIQTRDIENITYQTKQIIQFKASDVIWSIQITCEEVSTHNKIIVSRGQFEEKKREAKKIEMDKSKSKSKSKEEKEKEMVPINQKKQERIFKIQVMEPNFGFIKNSNILERTPQKIKKEDNSDSMSPRSPRFHQGSDSLSRSSSSQSEEANLRRGKGRPKGSKNRSKSINRNPATLSELKNSLQKRWQYGEHQTPISKQFLITPYKQVKVQDHNIIPQLIFNNRRKGRPKGAKNKLKSQHQVQEKSQSSQEQEYSLPLQINNDVQSITCCFRCSNRLLKQSFLSVSPSSYRRILTSTTSRTSNLWQDISSEKRSNIIINSLKKNIEPSQFQFLISRMNEFEPYFIPCWQYNNRIEDEGYMIKTNKHYLSIQGKEGNNALLHDCYVKPGIWWKQVGVRRILESLNNNSHQKIIDILKAHDPELSKEIDLNIPYLIRCGNHELARYLMAKTTMKYSKEHLEALQEHKSLTHFKRSNLLKSNPEKQSLAPIHILAMNPNPQLLESALKSLKQYDINDNLMRKPIHYACVAKLTTNMQIFLAYQSDLKITDKNRVTPLMLAAKHGKVNNLLFIMNRVPEALYLNLRCKDGLSALHYAIINERLECVKVLLNDRLVDPTLETRDRLTSLHLAAGIGNIHVVRELLEKEHPIDCRDRHKRTPLFFSIRNNNHAVSYELLRRGAKYWKKDNSMNSLLHYCAAYGNNLFLQHLIPHIKMSKNRDRYYPWEIAVGKGHIACIKLLDKYKKELGQNDNQKQKDSKKSRREKKQEQQHKCEERSKQKQSRLENSKPDFNMCFLNMKKIRYTPESMQIMNHLIDQHYKPHHQDINGSRLLHLVCSIKQSDYIKNRQLQTGRADKFHERRFREQFEKMQQELITKLQSKGSAANEENKFDETPVVICVEKENLLGLKLLLKNNLNLKFESSRGCTILHYLSRLCSEGVEGVKFVYKKFQEEDMKHKTKFRDSLKKVDKNGFEAILLFVKDFTFSAKSNFKKRVKELKERGGIELSNAEGIAFEEYKIHEEYFMRLIELMGYFGCNVNVTIAEKPNIQEEKQDSHTNQTSWGIQHFLMKFPTIPMLDFFKNKMKVRDFNALTTNKQTPLHLFCQWNKQGSLFEAELGTPNPNYCGEASLKYLLEMSCNTTYLDSTRSTALLYSALNKQIKFMLLLRNHNAPINTLNSLNQVPFIQIVKMKNSFTSQQFEQLLKAGADPNFQDLKKQTALHHLVHHSTPLDNTVQLCRLLLSYGAKINSMDHLERTPLFYCFTRINEDQSTYLHQDKLDILQTLLKQPGIDINHRDAYKKTALHYACQRNYFHSVMILLDKKIDFNGKDINSNTPLALCLINNCVDQAAMLIKKGVVEGYVIECENKKESYFSYCLNKLLMNLCFMLLDYGYPVDKAIQEANCSDVKIMIEKRYDKNIKKSSREVK